MVLEKTLESPLDSKEIKPINPKGNQSWIFIGRVEAEAEAPILWPPDVKNWPTGKDPDAGKGWRWEEKGMTEDEKVGWHHQLDGQEVEHAPGVGDGQGSLVCYSRWGCKMSDMTELNRTEPFPSSEDLPNPGIELMPPALQTDSLPSEPPRKPWNQIQFLSIKQNPAQLSKKEIDLHELRKNDFRSIKCS